MAQIQYVINCPVCSRNTPDSVHTLRMADVYFTHATREEKLDLLSLETFGEVFPVLQYNLSSPHSQVGQIWMMLV